MHQIQTEIDKNTKKIQVFENFMQFLCTFRKSWWLRKKDIQQGTISLSEKFLLRSRQSFLLKKNAQFATKNDENFKIFQLFTQLLSNFANFRGSKR